MTRVDARLGVACGWGRAQAAVVAAARTTSRQTRERTRSRGTPGAEGRMVSTMASPRVAVFWSRPVHCALEALGCQARVAAGARRMLGSGVGRSFGFASSPRCHRAVNGRVTGRVTGRHHRAAGLGAGRCDTLARFSAARGAVHDRFTLGIRRMRGAASGRLPARRLRARQPAVAHSRDPRTALPATFGRRSPRARRRRSALRPGSASAANAPR